MQRNSPALAADGVLQRPTFAVRANGFGVFAYAVVADGTAEAAADLAAAPQQHTALWGGSEHRVEAGLLRFNAAGGAAGACVQVCGQPEPNSGARRASTGSRYAAASRCSFHYCINRRMDYGRKGDAGKPSPYVSPCIVLF